MKINYNASQPGANRLMQAFLSPTRKNAEDNEMLRLAQTDQRMAAASKDNAEADLLNQRSSYLQDQPGFLSGQTGAPLPLAKKFSDYLKTGNWGQTEPPSSTDAEGALMAGAPPLPITEIPEEIKPLMDQFKRALQTQSGLRGSSAANPEQIAKSQGEYQGQGITDTAVDLARQGKFDEASSVNQAGKIGQQIKRYDDIGATGGVYNPSTGEVVASGNPLVNAFINKSNKTSNGGGIKLKQGERFTEDGNVEAIKGSDIYIKQSGLHSKDYNALLGVETKIKNAKNKIDNILDKKNKTAFDNNFGGYSAYATKLLPGETQDISTKIESLKSDMKSAGLELMRAGGSIGVMSVQEWPIVQDMINRVDPKMGVKAARQAFKEVDEYFDKIRENANEIYDTEWSETQFHKKNRPPPTGDKNTPPPSGIEAPAVGTVKNGYRFMGGNPSDKNSWKQEK